MKRIPGALSVFLVLLAPRFSEVAEADEPDLCGLEMEGAIFQVASFVVSIRSADVDRDGDQDVLTASSDPLGTVSLLRNGGNGTFGPAALLPTGEGCASVLAADLDLDGTMDLAATHAMTGAIAPRWGLGDGSFSEPPVLDSGLTSLDLVSADFDRDGRLDLASESIVENQVLVHRGDGSRGFHPASRILVGDEPVGLVTADLDLDGDVDMATINRVSEDITALLNDGKAAFSSSRVASTGPQPNRVTVADVDRDGDIDLAFVSGYHEGRLVISVQRTPLVFEEDASMAIGGDPQDLVIADLNRDGRQDFITANYLTRNVSVLFGADGRPHPPVFVATSPNRAVTATDLDGDGDLDLACAGRSYVETIRNEGARQFDIVEGMPPIPGLTRIVAGDWNTDGSPDLAGLARGPGRTIVLLNDGAATLAPSGEYSAGAQPFMPEVADFNGDDRTDMVIGGLESGEIAVLRGRGDGTFEEAEVSRGREGTTDLSRADLDGDGDIDLAIVGYNAAESDSSFAGLVHNDGTGVFGEVVRFSMERGDEQPESVVAADFDGDGDADLATTYLFLNEGGGSFSRSRRLFDSSRSLTAADLNADGRVDLVIAIRLDSGSVHVRLQEGSGVFAEPIVYVTDSSGGEPQSLGAADMDRDRDMDLVLANGNNHGASVFMNDSTGRFPLRLDFTVPREHTSVRSVEPGDFDGDGDQDLAIMNLEQGQTSGSIAFLRQVTEDEDSDGVPDGCSSPVRALRRGDGNGDYKVNIADPIFVLNYLFRGGPAPRCSNAADFNANGLIDVTDAILLIHFLVLDGTPPDARPPSCSPPM